MTMLDRMRRHKNWLKWSLILVCLAFVVFYIPDFLSNPTADLSTTNTIAVVGDREISGEEFQRAYQSQLQAYRSAYGDQMNDQLLRQLGIDQQVLQQLVDERAALTEGERLGLRVSPEEVRRRILTMAAFQENGAFIGETRYLQLLGMQQPPVLPDAFEESVRQALLLDKLRVALTDWMSVTDAELEEAYRRTNDKVKLALVSFPLDSFRPDVTATAEELASHFTQHTENFRIPEKRKIRYLLVDVDALQARTIVPPADVERLYNQNFDQYSEPDQIRASHILLRTEGKDEAAVRARTEALVKQARDGADFAALATANSEDETSVPAGGDLDFFSRGRMVQEFEDAAFTMEVGQVSEPVRSSFGYHVIKVTDKKPGLTRSLDEVRPQLTDQLAFERAQTEAQQLADRLSGTLRRPADLDTAAAANGLTVQESDLFGRNDPILGVGVAPDVAAGVFAMAEGTVAGPLPTPRGFVFASLVERKESYLPELEEVRERVRDDVLHAKAAEMALSMARDLSPRLKSASNFEAAAKAGGFAAETTELVTRDSPLPFLGTAPEVLKAAFAMPVGGVSDPLQSALGAAIIKVLEKEEVSVEELAENRDRFREELLADRRNRFFSAYMVKAKQNIPIQVNREAIQRMIG